MRPIKFRGFSTDSNQWVYGFYREYPIYQRCGTCLDHINYFIDLVGGGSEFVKPETVGQFTGLFDKNGKEIYEGDGIKTIFSYTEWCGYVTFLNGNFVLVDSDKNGQYLTLPALSGAEVIGNIHDNPELLKTK